MPSRAACPNGRLVRCWRARSALTYSGRISKRDLKQSRRLKVISRRHPCYGYRRAWALLRGPEGSRPMPSVGSGCGDKQDSRRGARRARHRLLSATSSDVDASTLQRPHRLLAPDQGEDIVRRDYSAAAGLRFRPDPIDRLALLAGRRLNRRRPAIFIVGLKRLPENKPPRPAFNGLARGEVFEENDL